MDLKISDSSGKKTLFDLIKLIKELQINSYNLMLRVSEDNRKIFGLSQKTIDETSELSIWSLSAVAVACAANIEPNTSNQDASLNQMLQIVKTTRDISGNVELNNPSNNFEIEFSLFSLIAQQGECQRNVIFDKARSSVLTNLISEKGDKIRSTSFFDPLFQKSFDCTLQEYSLFFIILLSLSQKSIIVNLKTVFKNSTNSSYLESLFQRIAEKHSIQFGKIEHTLKSDFEKYRGESLIQAFYMKYPLIKLDEHSYLLPPSMFLQMLYSTGIWVQTLILSEEFRQANDDDRRFNRRLGANFEKFIENLLLSSGVKDFYTDYQYTCPENQKTPDFMIFESSGRKKENLTIIEAKSRRPESSEIYGLDFLKFKESLKQTYAQSIWKPILHLYNMEKLSFENRLNQKEIKKTERVLKARKYLIIGIFPQMPAVFQIKIFRDMIEEEVLDQLEKKGALDWYKKKSKKIDWQIFDSNDLIYFLGSKKVSQGIFSVMGRYSRDNNLRFIGKDRLSLNFRDWFDVKWQEHAYENLNLSYIKSILKTHDEFVKKNII